MPGRGNVVRDRVLAGVAAAVVAAAASDARAQAAKSPVYVGAKACAACHDGKVSGHQYATWRETRHARAYLSLFTQEGREMARLSGVTDEPHRSPICLGCHATAAEAERWERDADFRLEDGVQCEKCHGPGSEYMDAAVMRDPEASRRAGLRKMTLRDCQVCHYAKGSHVTVHGKAPLDVEKAWARIAHRIDGNAAGEVRGTAARLEEPASPPPHTSLLSDLAVTYKNPLNLAFRPGGREVWVTCESAGTVVVVDARTRRKVDEIVVGPQATDVAFHPDGRRAYVSRRLDDAVSVIDTATRRVIQSIAVGDDPHGLAVDAAGGRLFVANTAADSISVVDLGTGAEMRRLAASRNPWSTALSPDGGQLLVTNALSRLVGFRMPPESEVTVVDAATGRITDRRTVPDANLLLGVAWHPSGEFALATLNRTKNLVPMTRLVQGWTITNGLAVLWKDGTVDEVLLDEPNRYFADATDVAFTPDGRLALVTSSGTNRVAIVDVEKLLALLRASSREERRDVLPNHLGRSTELVVGSVETKASPRGVAVSPDGKTAWVANSLDDSLTVIDLARREAVARVDLGGPTTITRLRRGERLFHSARIAFQRQFSCHTCHPDGHVDGITYDIEADGIGVSPVDNRTLRGIFDTDPFKWEGTNVTLARQCGPRLAVFFTRIDPFTPDELSALNDYTVTLPRPPNRHRPPGAELTAAQRRGKRLFERTRANDGREVPPEGRCVTCHFPPYYSDRSRRDVGTRQALDRQGRFDVPALNNIYDSAPYLHNGMAPTLEEIWTRFNPYDTHGVTNDMTKDQLNDLVEYLKTL